MLFKVAASALALGAVASATYGPAEVTYTSIEHVTITSCAPEYTECPAAAPTTHYAVSTCTEEGVIPTPPSGYAPVTSASVPVPDYYGTPVPQPPVSYGVPEVSVVTQTTSTCTEGHGDYTPVPPPVYSSPVDVPVYSSPVESVPVYSSPVESVPVYTQPPVYTPPAPVYPPTNATTPIYSVPQSMSTVVVTVCPGVNYCYATTTIVPSVSSTPAVPIATPSTPSSCPGGYNCPPTVPSVSTPAVPVATPSTPSSCAPGSYCPGSNTTVPVKPSAPAYVGNSAAGNKVSAAVLAIAAVAGLFIVA